MINYQEFLTIVTRAKEKLKRLAIVARKNPVSPFVIIGLLIFLSFVFFGKSSSPKPHPLMEETVPFDEQVVDMTGVKESFDPRDVWTANVKEEVRNNAEQLQKKLDQRALESDIELKAVKEEINGLKSLIIEQQKALEDAKHSVDLNTNNELDHLPVAVLAPSKTLGVFSKDYGDKKRNIKDYIPAATQVRTVLMTGAIVGTGTDTQSNPVPIKLRFTDAGIIGKGHRMEVLKHADLIGYCSGNISSERADCNLQKLTIVNNKGEIIEKAVKGWVVGEDGRQGVKGIVVDKSSDLLRMSMVTGMMSGFSQFLQNQSTKSVFPISPITGQQNSLNSSNALKGGVASGLGDAFAKIADFGISRFNAMSPQIVIASGREVDVMFGEGFDLKSFVDEVNGKTLEKKSSDGNLQSMNDSSAGSNVAYSKEGFDAFKETLGQMNANKANKEGHDGF